MVRVVQNYENFATWKGEDRIWKNLKVADNLLDSILEPWYQKCNILKMEKQRVVKRSAYNSITGRVDGQPECLYRTIPTLLAPSIRYLIMRAFTSSFISNTILG